MTVKLLQNVYIRSLLLCLIIACLSIPGNAAKKTTYNILVVGDSLSAAFGMQPKQGWVHLLQKRLQPYQANYQVINASISGDTTAGGLARLPALLKLHKPHIVIIELGANDGLRGLSLKAMRKNLTSMVKQSQTKGAKVLLIGVRIPPNYGPQYTKKFRQVYLGLTRHHQVSLVPYLLNGVSDKLELMQADTFHPRAEAQDTILDNVWVKLKRMLDKG